MDNSPFAALIQRLRQQFGGPADPIINALEGFLGQLDVVPKSEYERLSAEVAALHGRIERLEADLQAPPDASSSS
ncbi:MAG: hypothetical protein AAF648_03940 [Pseudomonadota bacterium]